MERETMIILNVEVLGLFYLPIPYMRFTRAFTIGKERSMSINPVIENFRAVFAFFTFSASPSADV
jgi:hypothetical protein